MATEPSSQAIEASPQSAKRPHPPSSRLVAATVGWFFGWPIVFFACLPLVTPGNELEAWLFGAGSVLGRVRRWGLRLGVCDGRSALADGGYCQENPGSFC
jgi:hypothetical protein